MLSNVVGYWANIFGGLISEGLIFGWAYIRGWAYIWNGLIFGMK